MKRILLLSTFIFSLVFAQSKVVGKITNLQNNKPLIGANVHIENTLFGTSTDENGYFEIKSLEKGRHIILIGYIGFEQITRVITIKENETLRIDFQMKPVDIEFETIVVTGTRTEKKRTEVPVIVNIIDSKTFDITQSASLVDGLSFQPGVRMEIDCQTCNYSQIRMNGLGGSYSQILINSRPVFSALNGLYGLEQIPANMLERVEVVRGGGSALFGASAVAGTINLITKDPVENNFTFSVSNDNINGSANDQSVNVNSSIVNSDRSSGLSIFGVLRNREDYDANGDGFSEMPKLKNNSFGLNSFFKVADLTKLIVDFHSIYEQRRGGDKIDLAPHKASQSEDRTHNIYGGGITLEHNFPSLLSTISFYTSGQYTDRKHYTGIGGVDAYGTTENTTLVAGVQFSRTHENFLGGLINTITVGVEGNYDDVNDEIPGYNHYLAQITRQIGAYFQFDWKVNKKLSTLVGLRLDKHSKLDKAVLNPRFNILYNITPELQNRFSVSTGFRAPQAFDADLHIAFSGGGISRIEIDPHLKKESSTSLSTSLDYNHAHVNYIYGFTVEGFYTRLNDVFILEELGADPKQPVNTILLRKNGGVANVFGGTVEGRMNWNNKLNWNLGLTYQKSRYDKIIKWSADIPGTKDFLRTPELYGYFVFSYNFSKAFTASVSGVYTGSMKVPHVAGAPGVLTDELVKTGTFIDTNIKLAYTFYSNTVLESVQLYGGVKNVFNHYQNDFDIGANRDSNYIYGPAKPRSVFFGIKIGTL